MTASLAIKFRETKKTNQFFLMIAYTVMPRSRSSIQIMRGEKKAFIFDFDPVLCIFIRRTLLKNCIMNGKCCQSANIFDILTL